MTGAVLCEERVQYFWTLVAVFRTLLLGKAKWIEVSGHHALGRDVRPLALFTMRAVAVVVRNDLWLDLGLNVGEQLLHLVEIDIGQFLLDHEPSHRI